MKFLSEESLNIGGTAQGVELFGNYFKFKGIGFAMIALECSEDFTIAVFDLSGLLHVIK